MAKAKEIAGLNCEGSAAVGHRLVLCTRLEEVCHFRAAALDWSDPIGVHDMRVATRRLRSAVRDFKPYLRQRKLADCTADLKRLAETLGQVRDQDVGINALEELQSEAQTDATAGIGLLINERRAAREAARAALIDALNEEKLNAFRAAFAEAIERATEARGSSEQGKNKRVAAADLNFSQAQREIILVRLQELRGLSACLSRPFKVKPLHRMRIAAKRLRYAIEMLAACRGHELAALAKEVSDLQTALGELHDCDVWLESCGRMLRDFERRRERPGAHLTHELEQKRSAAIWLMHKFAKARMKHFGDALALWHEWETGGFFTRLEVSLGPTLPTSASSTVALTAPEAAAFDAEAREPS
jgi:CHAD domain-containing protein